MRQQFFGAALAVTAGDADHDQIDAPGDNRARLIDDLIFFQIVSGCNPKTTSAIINGKKHPLPAGKTRQWQSEAGSFRPKASWKSQNLNQKQQNAPRRLRKPILREFRMEQIAPQDAPKDRNPGKKYRYGQQDKEPDFLRPK